jgi:hypothetical protein
MGESRRSWAAPLTRNPERRSLDLCFSPEIRPCKIGRCFWKAQLSRLSVPSRKDSLVLGIRQTEVSADVSKRRSVCAIVVTFHPGPDLATNLGLLSSQVDHIVVVDNGSNSVETLSVLNLLEEQLRCTFLQNGKNLGIAAALNRGCEQAVKKGFAWIVTFDQDSTVNENFIEALLLDAARVKDLGMISPRYVDRHSGKVIALPKTP